MSSLLCGFHCLLSCILLCLLLNMLLFFRALCPYHSKHPMSTQLYGLLSMFHRCYIFCNAYHLLNLSTNQIQLLCGLLSMFRKWYIFCNELNLMSTNQIQLLCGFHCLLSCILLCFWLNKALFFGALYLIQSLSNFPKNPSFLRDFRCLLSCILLCLLLNMLLFFRVLCPYHSNLSTSNQLYEILLA